MPRTARTCRKGRPLPLAFAAALRRLTDVDGLPAVARATKLGAEALLGAMAERPCVTRTFEASVGYVAGALVRLGAAAKGSSAAELEVAAGKWAAAQARERGLA